MRDANGLVLIVDDTQENILVLGSLLRDAGYNINVATNGEQALATLERITPDLVLLDVMMPVMDGFEVCRRMQEHETWRSIPVIFLTAKVETENIIEGFELGAVDYVTKPFQSSELLQRVETHLTLSRLRRELSLRVDELSEALARIEQLRREQDAFLRHELNNVINPISGYADMLSTFVGPQLEEKPRAWLSSIVRGAASMQRLLSDLKDLNDVERGGHALSLMPVPLYGILEDVIRDVDASMAVDVPILLQPASLDARVSADLSFLPGVFKNLIKNAVEHVASADPSVWQDGVRVHCSLSPTEVITDITNGGPPVPEDRLATFFEKFNSTKTGSGGTGLGTTYARIVTEAHGGSIAVHSSAEEGTRVRVELPRIVA